MQVSVIYLFSSLYSSTYNQQTNNMALFLTSNFSPVSITMLLYFFLLTLRTSHCIPNPTKANPTAARQLSNDFYAKSCPQLDQLVGSVTAQQFREAPVSGPATIRLFFHDCFVEVIPPQFTPNSVSSIECWLVHVSRSGHIMCTSLCLLHFSQQS